MQNSNRQIKLGGIISYITIVFTIVSGLIYTPWMISEIGQSNFGLFTLVTSLITMVTLDLGLSQSVTRFISKYRAENDIVSIKRFLGIVYKLFILLAFVFLIALTVVFFNIDSIYKKLTYEEIEKLKTLLIIAGLYSVFSFPFHPLDGILVSGEWFIFQKTAGLIYRVLNISFMVIALLLGYGLFALVVVNALCGIIIIVMKLRFLKKNDPLPIDWGYFDKNTTKEIFAFSVWVMVISISQRLILNITPSVLGITSGSAEIAIFSAANSIEGYVWTFSTVFSGMFLPKISKLVYGDKVEPEVIQDLMIRVGRIIFIMLAAIVSVFIVIGRDFFLQWLGPDFEKSYIITVFLILSGLLTTPQQIASTTLIVKNKIRFNALSKILIAVISVSLSYVLSLRFGALGSGVAIFIGNIIGGAIVLNIIYYKVLHINVWMFFRKCQLSMSLPFIMVILIGFTLNFYFTEGNWLSISMKIIILIIVYMVVAYFFAINNGEKKLIADSVKSILSWKSKTQ
jgi:O-antigen/teichoic acid export membrane protein